MRHLDMGRWFLKTMLKKSRLAAEKSQREVAEEVVRSIDTIRDWEKGRTDIPYSSIDALAAACEMSDELKMYMKKVAKARKKGEPIPIEADMRFNAMYLSLGEEYYGDIFKWSSVLIPGPLQTRDFHFTVARKVDPEASDQSLERSWTFKSERRSALEARQDKPKVRFLIGEAAFFFLKKEPEELQHEQLEYLSACNRRPGWEIRVLTEPWPNRLGNFDIYKPGPNNSAGPPFVYTEVYDSSWCIPTGVRIARYHEFRRNRWPTATRYEEYRNDY